jgi:hypothetical protein
LLPENLAEEVSVSLFGGRSEDLLCRPDFVDQAIVEEGDAVRNVARGTHLMGDANHRHALVGRHPHRVEDFADRFRVGVSSIVAVTPGDAVRSLRWSTSKPTGRLFSSRNPVGGKSSVTLQRNSAAEMMPSSLSASAPVGATATTTHTNADRSDRMLFMSGFPLLGSVRFIRNQQIEFLQIIYNLSIASRRSE